MTSKFLVTTALEQTWESEFPILFLGEWCKKYQRREIWKSLDAEVCPDPWSDRKRRIDAYVYTGDLFERMLISLTSQLNTFHSTSHSLNFWRILIGPWLHCYINSFFHHWETISDATNAYRIQNTLILQYNESSLIAQDMNQFEIIMISDWWNHCVIAKIIEYQNKIERKVSSSFSKPEYINANSTSSSFFHLFSKLAVFSRFNNDSLIINPYFSKTVQLKILWKLKQFPSVLPSALDLTEATDVHTRKDMVLCWFSPTTEFEKFCSENVFLHLPRSYLEGFNSLHQAVKVIKWPEKPKFMTTATSHWSCDAFKYYAGIKVDQGVALKIICHGGGGKYLYSDFQDHELKICRDYFTWGWSEYASNCYKGFSVKTSGRKLPKKNKKILLHLLMTEHRYAKFISAVPSYEQFARSYIKDQAIFLSCLSADIRRETISKLSRDTESVDRRIKDLITEDLNGHSFAYENANYWALLAESKLVIGTYNCTTFVESIALDIPTLLFFQPAHWELSKSAQPYFGELNRCGIFHESPNSAAKKVNEVWDNVDLWWNSLETSKARDNFRNWFARYSADPAGDAINFFMA